MIILTGASASGKTETALGLARKYGLVKAITTTTREIRINETNGVDYFFLSKDEFLNKAKKGFFVETTLYNDNYYGTSREIVVNKINSGINVFSEIDVNGAHNIKKVFPDALLIYIAPPSIEVLKERLISRGTESIEKINQRLEIAERELKEVDFYDYVVINDDLDKATDEVRNIIAKKI